VGVPESHLNLLWPISSVGERLVYTEDVGSSTLSSATINADMAKLVDALVLGTSGQPWEFESLYPHQLCLYSIKVVHGFGKAETQDRYLLEAPDK
jgi:hypothetical protein